MGTNHTELLGFDPSHSAATRQVFVRDESDEEEDEEEDEDESDDENDDDEEEDDGYSE